MKKLSLIVLLVVCTSLGGRQRYESVSTGLIAHYKMNENTASDNDELVTNGNFAAWTTDDPDGWDIDGETGNDPEVSEAATGEAHADTPTLGGGYCNLYCTNPNALIISQNIVTVIGRKYKISTNVDTVTSGAVRIHNVGHLQWPNIDADAAGVYSEAFVCTQSTTSLLLEDIEWTEDVTVDDVSMKLCAAEDSSGNDHDGLLAEDTDAAHVVGKTDGAFDFDGSADYIEIADHASFTPAGTPFSISAWVYMHNATEFVIATKGVYNTDGEWRFATETNDKLYAVFFDESVANCYIGRKYNTAIVANTWYHAVMTYDGGTTSASIKLYLSGKRADNADNENAAGSFVAVENLTHAVHIGRDYTTYANGLIDNVMFFSTELTPTQVRKLYNSGRGTEMPDTLRERY